MEKKWVSVIAVFKTYGLLRTDLSSFILVGQVIPCADYKNYYNKHSFTINFTFIVYIPIELTKPGLGICTKAETWVLSLTKYRKPNTILWALNTFKYVLI